MTNAASKRVSIGVLLLAKHSTPHDRRPAPRPHAGFRRPLCAGLPRVAGGPHARFACDFPLSDLRRARCRRAQVGRRRQRVRRLLRRPRRAALRPFASAARRSGAAPGGARHALGASHELEVRWAELVQRLVPSAERVRFTGSGTEASQLALRLARAYTGKTKIMRFVGHFHGWHDAVAPGGMSHYDGSVPVGIPESLVRETLLLPADDAGPVLDLLQTRNDIAAVIVEPSGASWGQVPLPPGFLAALREATRKRDAVLVFDEVITGFRWSRGGAQARYGIVPDLTVLAKILAGGLPGGAVAGAKDILDQLDPAAAKAARREKIGHQGTF